MKLPLRKKLPGPGGRIALAGGAYAMAASALVLAILVVINLFASLLPSAWTEYDISAAKLYSVTSNTKAVLTNLDQEVTIYWVVQAGQEDTVLQKLLQQYQSLSGYIRVERRDPDAYPTFAAQYTSETVANNSLVVECGSRSRYIGYDDIYLQQADIYSYNYNVSFDGEGALTSAIDYVVNASQPLLYLLQGHGEAELPETFASQIESENIQTAPLSLLTAGSVPEDASCVLVYAPASDISQQEKQLLAQYLQQGGKLLVAAGPVEQGTLTNLYSLLGDYGVEAAEGIVVDPDREHYAFQMPYVLLPDMADSSITAPLVQNHYYAILPLAQGLTFAEDNAAVSALLTTSASAYSKAAGYALDTYEWEQGDTSGPFAVAVQVQAGQGQMIWFASSEFLSDMYNAYSSGANTDLAMNALSALVGQSEAVAIRSKSLNYNYLTISSATASLLRLLLVAVFPLCYLAIGVTVVLHRRAKQNEPY